MFQPDELKALLNQLRKHWFTQVILISKHVLKKQKIFPNTVVFKTYSDSLLKKLAHENVLKYFSSLRLSTRISWRKNRRLKNQRRWCYWWGVADPFSPTAVEWKTGKIFKKDSTFYTFRQQQQSEAKKVCKHQKKNRCFSHQWLVQLSSTAQKYEMLAGTRIKGNERKREF